MTLDQMFAFVNKKTYFSRDDDEIWDAISEAASTLFLKVTSENSGFFLKWDTTTVALAPNVEEYTLPPDLGQMIRVRERLSATEPWRRMTPSSLNSDSFNQAQFNGLIGDSLDSAESEFEYYGPYLLAADANTAAQVQKFRIAPIPQDARFVELVYAAKFLEITGQESDFLVIPTEGHGVVKNDAVASLLGANDDDNEARFTGYARTNEREFLKWIRNRQFQQGRQVETYLDDLD